MFSLKNNRESIITFSDIDWAMNSNQENVNYIRFWQIKIPKARILLIVSNLRRRKDFPLANQKRKFVINMTMIRKREQVVPLKKLVEGILRRAIKKDLKTVAILNGEEFHRKIHLMLNQLIWSINQIANWWNIDFNLLYHSISHSANFLVMNHKTKVTHLNAHPRMNNHLLYLAMMIFSLMWLLVWKKKTKFSYFTLLGLLQSVYCELSGFSPKFS